jgi:large repetitive protein
MRHRASRSFLPPLSRLPRLRVPGPGRRRVVAAGVLAVTAALTGVGVAVQGGEAEPSAADAPVTVDLGTPAASDPSGATWTPSKAVSRGGDRRPHESTTPLPSTSAPSPTVPSPSEALATALPRVSRTPTAGPTGGSASKVPTPSAPSPVDEAAPETTASTSAVSADSWTVAVSADEPATYQCSLDGGSFEACGAITTFSGLDRGRHSLTARAIDGAGNTDPSPVEITTQVNGSS